MLSISHMATGAFLASQLPHPALYIPLTLVTHYLEDWTPHWDVGTGLSNGKRSRQAAFLLEIGDLILAISLVYLFWQSGQAEIQYHVWAGAFVGLIPDFLEAPRNFFRWEPAFLRPLNEFHSHWHHSIPHVFWGLVPQIVLIFLIWILK